MDDVRLHTLKANAETVHWGYYDNSLKPAVSMDSGDLVYVETVTQQAGDAPDLLMDEAIEEIYRSIPAEARTPGPHLLTGPIYVRDAKPGDMLEVEILDLTPRMPYGSNVLGSWGYLHEEFDRKERVTIYELDEQGQWLTAKFSYECEGEYVNGAITDPQSVRRLPALPGIQVPARLHIGTMAVAPAEPGRINTVPPGKHGGNIDNWRIGKGATMYYPVQVEGALLSLGDCHMAQGDSELSGTAVEASLNVLLRIKVRKDFYFDSPILETPEAWITHAFDPDLNKATRLAALEMLNFLQKFHGLSREDAYSLISIAADFSITQVVDERQGVHVSIPKKVFAPK